MYHVQAEPDIFTLYGISAMDKYNHNQSRQDIRPRSTNKYRVMETKVQFKGCGNRKL